MEQQAIENKKFILKYFNAISKKTKTPELCNQFMTDEKLKENIYFFESIFPKYELIADELIADGNKVMVRARCLAVHKGTFKGIPPTDTKVEFPFVIRYIIKDGKIVDHWILADEMSLMEQLGVVKALDPA